MKKQKSAGAVLYRKGEEVLYLLLHYEMGHWDFPKGKIEEGEKDKETVKREIEEETSIKEIDIKEGFLEEIKYYYHFNNEIIDKKVLFYVAETKEKDIKLSNEHKGYIWLNFDESLKKLTFENAKELLKKAGKFISEQSR